MRSSVRRDHFRALLRDENGATAVEYGLIVAALAGAIIAVVMSLGKKVNNTFNNIQSRMP
jgi:pilus assembly protein Flp/PilA